MTRTESGQKLRKNKMRWYIFVVLLKESAASLDSIKFYCFSLNSYTQDKIQLQGVSKHKRIRPFFVGICRPLLFCRGRSPPANLKF